MKRMAVLLAACALSACELEEAVVTSAQDVVIAAMYLRTDRPVQTALLHRTRQPGDSTRPVPGALIEVANQGGNVLQLRAAPDSMCVLAQSVTSDIVIGTCYASDPQVRYDIVPGERYSLRIILPEGGELTATTTVPQDFLVIRPAARVCALPAATRFEAQWTQSPGAWVYAAETNMRGLRQLLAEQGVELDRDPLRLFGLSVSSADTAIVFPSEFGLFDRFDDDLTEALAAIQGGLPSGVVADVVIAAADRNYVNWERGGNFNPSGVVRIGSVRGDGFGVFGSLVVKSFQIRVGSTDYPPC